MDLHKQQFGRRAVLRSGAALACVFLAGCSNGGGSENAAGTSSAGGTKGATTGAGTERKTIRIGFSPTIVQPQALLGAASGAYKTVLPSADVSFKEFVAGPEVVENIRGGVIDIGCSGPFPAMKAYLKAADIVLLCGAASGGIEVMVAGQGPIQSVKDLKGKVIGVNQLGSNVETLVKYQVLQAGLSPESDVKFIQVKPAEQAEALQRGEVAAVAAPAPWPSSVQINAKARPLLNWKSIYEGGNYLAGSFYASKKWVEANPELARGFIAATKKMTGDLNADRAKADAQVLAAWEKVSKKTLEPDVAKAAFQTIRYTTDASEAGLQKFADVNFELGVIKQKPDVKGFVWK